MKLPILMIGLAVIFAAQTYAASTYCIILSGSTVCINGTILVGTKIDASDVLNLPNSSGSNNYTTGIAFNQNASTYTLQLSRSGANNLSASFTIPASGGNSISITAGPNWPVQRNATNSSVLENLNLTCGAGYALSSVTNNSVCTQFETPASAAATYYPLTNPAGYTSNTGTVTSVATGNGLTGGPITTSGTVSVNATTCTAGNYTQWNGSAFNCQPITAGGTSNATDNTAYSYIPVQTGNGASNLTSSLFSADSAGQLKYNANGGPSNWTQRASVDLISVVGGAVLSFIRSNSTYGTIDTSGGSPSGIHFRTFTNVAQTWLTGSLAGTTFSSNDVTFGSNILVPPFFIDADRGGVCVNCNTTESNVTIIGNTTMRVASNQLALTLENTNAGRTETFMVNRPGVGGLYMTTTGGTPATAQIGAKDLSLVSYGSITIATATHQNISKGDIVLGNLGSLTVPGVFIPYNRTGVGIGNFQPNRTLDVSGTVGAQEFFINGTGAQAQINLKMPVHSFNVTCAAGTYPQSFAFNTDGSQNGTTCVADQSSNGTGGGISGVTTTNSDGFLNVSSNGTNIETNLNVSAMLGSFAPKRNINMTVQQVATTNDTVYTKLDNLTLYLNGNTTYTINCNLRTSAAAVGTGAQIRQNTTGSPTAVSTSYSSFSSASAMETFVGTNTTSNAFADLGSATSLAAAWIYASVQTGAADSVWTLELKTELAGSAARIGPGSMCEAIAQ